MDTYFSTNEKCIVCGKCVEACHKDGESLLCLNEGGLYEWDDGEVWKLIHISRQDMIIFLCHHCTEKFTKPAPCQEVCEQDAITMYKMVIAIKRFIELIGVDNYDS